MHVETGRVRVLCDGEEPDRDEVFVHLEQMTEKQMETYQVSKYDNRSELGKVFTGNRKQRREQEREYLREQKRKRKSRLSQQEEKA